MKRRIIIDENLPDRIADILQLTFKGMDVTSLKRHHEKGTKDIDWMRDLATWRPQPVVLTCDRRIQTRELERKALQESGLTYVVIASSWMNHGFDGQIWRLLKVWPDVQARINSLQPGPSVVEVDITRGTVALRH